MKTTKQIKLNKEESMIYKMLMDIRRCQKGAYSAALTDEGYRKGIYSICIDTYGYVIWKKTFIEEQPEYKGEHLMKYFPDSMDMYDLKAVRKLLRAQIWSYN